MARQARPWLTLAALVLITIYLLRRQGRRWWCACGQPNLWSGDIHSSHNSQHLLDPYSFTHILHGLLFYRLLARFLPRLAPLWRLGLALGVEALWEVAENSEAVIERYRQATISLGYHGDTIANSLGDLLSCGAGFVLAHRLSLRCSLVLFTATELGLLLWIRDNLTLNVLMLIYPIDAIKKWQTRQ
jgi:hypothetical protein